MQDKIITHLNFAKGFRGGERQTLLLIEELSRRGYRQKIITRKNSEFVKRLTGISNLKIIKISKPYLFHLNVIKDTFLLHAHETKAAQFAYFAHLIYGVPYIVTRRVNNPIKNNFFNKKIYTKANYTIVLSHAIKNQVFKISKETNIKIIPDAYSQLEMSESNIEGLKQRFANKFIIGCIGELESAKGQYYLIEAMKKIQINYPNIHLIFLGRGKDEKNYKEQSKDLDNITFEGFVDNVGDYIHIFDLFVFPSLNEGLGSILFDVMQANVPIVASDVGGIPDIIQNEENGLLVAIRESEAIYLAIERLYLDANLRKKLSDKAFENIENFSFMKMTDGYEDIYKEVL
ncbi:MAG: glycosyltransferase family 4 protein [Sulfurovum sp.]|nr:glycosyltransferase family 4 protein [Sulfurovum sp.]